MGYNTEFTGVLKFNEEPTASELRRLGEILGEDCRDHPEWGEKAEGLTHIDLQATDDYYGIEWNGSEKTYDLTEKVNLVIDLMQKHNPKFGLHGAIIAKGEDRDDVWQLLMTSNGVAEKQMIPVDHSKDIICPHCKYQITECPSCGHDLP